MLSGNGRALAGLLFVIVAFQACGDGQKFVSSTPVEQATDDVVVAPPEETGPRLPALERGNEETPPVTPSPTPSPEPTPEATPTPIPNQNIVDSYVQLPGKVDILWVMDNSFSMDWAQTQLVAEFAKFTSALSEAQLDFQVGLTSTDVCSFDPVSGAGFSNEFCPDASQIKVRYDKGAWVGPARGALIADPLSGERILKPGADFTARFQSLAKLGVDGSTLEHGLYAARRAIEQAGNGGINSGFLRPEAGLAVIVVSDEEDDGIQFWCEDAWGRSIKGTNGRTDPGACDPVYGTSPYRDMFGVLPFAFWNWQGGVPMSRHKYTADDFVGFLASPAVKPRGHFQVSTFTGMRDATGRIECNNPSIAAGTGPQESGTNYIKAAELTGGFAANICTPEWGAALKRMGEEAAELVAYRDLTPGKPVIPGTLSIKVNGAVLPASDYSIDLAKHQILFKAAPAVGSAVEIVYESPN